jgi:hypothetical protein
MPKLDIDYQINFELIGIISSEREHKMAWLLNQALGITLSKQQDLSFSHLKGNAEIVNYCFSTPNASLRLLKNKAYLSEMGSLFYLIPELRQYDYFLRIENAKEIASTTLLCYLIKNLAQVQFVIEISPSELKSKHNFYF